MRSKLAIWYRPRPCFNWLVITNDTPGDSFFSEQNKSKTRRVYELSPIAVSLMTYFRQQSLSVNVEGF